MIIHGKHYHEETRATASQALTHAGGQYLCVRDVAETERLCEFILGKRSAADLMAEFRDAASPGFDPDRDLQRMGLANQTTMLMTETLKVQETLRRAIVERQGSDDIEGVLPRLRHHLLGDAGAPGRRARHAQRRRSRPDGRDRRLQQQQHPGAGADVRAARPHVLHRQPQLRRGHCHPPPRGRRGRPKRRTEGWLPAGPCTIGITAGASTPDSVVGEVLERILALRGCTAADLVATGVAAAGAQIS